MRTTGVFTIHRFVINFEKYNEPIYLVPFGDVHKSSPLHHAEKWQETLDWAKSKQRAYFLGMGDYNDLASTSERMVMGNPNLHESTVKTLEQLYLTQTMSFAKDIKFMGKRLIGIMGGNHYGVFKNGITTDQKLAELLDTTYLGVNSFIRLSFHCSGRGNNGHVNAVDIFAHHGRGGGRTVGGSMNPVQQMAQTAEADIYLMGDNHRKGVDFMTRLCLDGISSPSLRQRKILLARTGSFLKGYEPGCESYVVDSLMSPTDLGVVKIELTPRRVRAEGQDRTYIDVHASI